ncbi:hypothetical protein CLOM_g8496 [Closterium sp. NIES-68]|nr:hypothetical protein CLOM_g8496 [Closterium sp. NIES-68]GJP78348.1 hypothetical protein CLOP_g8665 [Closterium sp. NIES-67]
MSTRLSEARLRQSIAQYVVDADVSFRTVENPSLLTICNSLCGKEITIPDRITVSRDVRYFAGRARE